MTNLERRLGEGRKRMQSLAVDQLARIDWPRERLEAYRRERLREAIAHATLRSAWHRERLSTPDPEELEIEHLANLPSMTKADLNDHFDRISTDPRVTRARCEQHLEGDDALLDGEFTVTASGGTSGVRALCATHFDDMIETAGAGLIRFVMRWARRTGRQGRPDPPFAVASGAGHHGAGILKGLLGSGPDRSVSVLDPIDRVVAALNAAEPEHVIVYSSFIPRLVEEVRAGRLRIRPQILTPVAESFLPEHETAVADVWDCVVMSLWGATETGMLGAGSGLDPGMLLLDDEVVVEPVDSSGEPVPPGIEADKLLVTRLSPSVIPLIRYELTDQLTVLDAPASCGSAFKRVSYVRGRQDEIFRYDGGVTVHPHTFRSVLSRERSIAEYQVEQTPAGAHLRVVPVSGASGLDRERIAETLGERLARLGVARPRVELSVVRLIPRTAGAAKLRRFVPLPAGTRSDSWGRPASHVSADL